MGHLSKYLVKQRGGVNSAEKEIDDFSPPLDMGIASAVKILKNHSVETFESCEGGVGHAYPEPTIRFHGDRSEGFRALAIALQNGLDVESIRRIWTIIDGEPTGPWWEITFFTKAR